MTPKLLLRIAAILLLLFAAGHTTGHLGRKNTTDPQGKEVIKAMEDYHFMFNGTAQSFDDHMEGYGITITFILVAMSMLLFIVSSNYGKSLQYSEQILYPVLFFMIANTYVAYRYFFLGPAIFSALVCVLIIFSIGLLKRLRNSPKE